MLVISIQSQVVHGHVGNSAAVYPMQAHGITVAAVPTTLLSNHPRYPTVHGRVLDAGMVAELLLGVEERGLIQQAKVLLTGYLGSPAVAAVVADFVERAKRLNPDLIYLCDPVMGDDDSGLFVAAELPPLFRERLIPQASVITPNQFELAHVAGHPLRDMDRLLAAASSLAQSGSPAVLVTGCTLTDTAAGRIETILCDPNAPKRIGTPRLPIRPCGTGDLLAGLVSAHLARGLDLAAAAEQAVAEVFSVLQRTQEAGTEEMQLIG